MSAASIVARVTRSVRDPNPILVKELRAIFRTALFSRFLYLTTLLAGIIVIVGGAGTASSGLPPATVGQIAFQLFFGVSLLVLMLVAAPYSSTALTSEKEGRTYESLLLSGLDPARIVWGKFLASYGSFALVLIALAPAVGIALLFGGVSPLHVIAGYAGLLLLLAPAIGFGIAVSARLGSTRIAIVVSLVLFFFAASVLLGAEWAIGESLKSAWGFSMSGPFWFTDALVTRPLSVEVLATVVALPAFLSIITTWFFLATAVAAIRPAAEDRSSPLKVWAVASLSGLLLTVLGFALSTGSDSSKAGIVMSIVAGPLLCFYALLLADEPPLPPRVTELAPARGIVRSAFRGAFGPGAVPSLRFTWVSLGVLALGTPLVSIAAALVVDPGHVRADLVEAHLGLVLGHLPAIALCAAFAAWLRSVLRSGLATRVLSLTLIAAIVFVPLMLTVAFDSDAFDDMRHRTPLLLLFSPIYGDFVGVMRADSSGSTAAVTALFAPAIVYTGAALVFAGLLYARVASVRSRVVAWRAERDARVAAMSAARAQAAAARRSSAPPAPPAPAAAGEPGP